MVTRKEAEKLLMEEAKLSESDLEPNLPIKVEEYKKILIQIYENILEVLKNYSDLKDKDYQIIALWVIGTYFYKEFLTFPYLFLNAMKGSGKSRTLRLICSLSWNGQQLGSMTEASLFRTAGQGTLGLDEFEGIAKKENHGLREILNSGYKKGMKIIRMRKQKTPEGEQQVAEYFEPYTPIVMANIWGMEEVLSDRCITAILEKSNKPQFTLKMEDFDNDLMIKSIKNGLNSLKNIGLVSLCRYFSENSIYTEWNKWVNYTYNNTTTLTTLTTLTTETTPPTNLELGCFFNQIINTGLNGRDLELFLPLFIIADVVGKNVLEKILEIAKESTKEKKHDEMMESKDIMLLEFVSEKDDYYYQIKELTQLFKQFIDYDENDEYSRWLNPKWMGRALKRLGLIIDKRRMGTGREVTLNIIKAKEKIKMFK